MICFPPSPFLGLKAEFLAGQLRMRLLEKIHAGAWSLLWVVSPGQSLLWAVTRDGLSLGLSLLGMVSPLGGFSSGWSLLWAVSPSDFGLLDRHLEDIASSYVMTFRTSGWSSVSCYYGDNRGPRAHRPHPQQHDSSHITFFLHFVSGNAGVWWRMLVFGGECWCLVEMAGVWWRMLVFGGDGWCLVENAGVWWRMLVFGGECWCLVENAGAWWRMLVFGGDGWCLVENAGVWWRWLVLGGECWCLVENAGVWWRWLVLGGECWCLVEMAGAWWRMLVFGGECWCLVEMAGVCGEFWCLVKNVGYGFDPVTSTPTPLQGFDSVTDTTTPLQGFDSVTSTPAPLQGFDSVTDTPTPLQGFDSPYTNPYTTQYPTLNLRPPIALVMPLHHPYTRIWYSSSPSQPHPPAEVAEFLQVELFTGVDKQVEKWVGRQMDDPAVGGVHTLLMWVVVWVVCMHS
ncbi:hypothetical protein P4O66_001831 [Electrophorus voltai]|uniref:Uncharacterized protein n=1 Tax=Electrophorus voltai TaxID=2609070 RepID=A0AAD8Z649_9TELE|nr:hypothetical protein P4O66_001831 [Electrophorus voltai]